MEINKASSTDRANSEETPNGKKNTSHTNCHSIALDALNGQNRRRLLNHNTDSNNSETQEKEDPGGPGKAIITLILIV